ncbi:hypothetical protein HPB50_010569 [Hyalomma asiaticum]|uniref:Uncharacterized protein n=1 Tax=Hyalomma asiaticum TaxID=266040 RepID=A0ACB7T1X7_HYAAI|nr:hypothetical protein HPB50_010569 [Hyalomma asiaticum]
MEMLGNPLSLGLSTFNLDVITYIVTEKPFGDNALWLITFSKKEMLRALNRRIPGANIRWCRQRGFYQDPLPPAIGDSYLFSYAVYKEKRAIRYASKSKVGRNVRPPGWNKVGLPVFQKDLYREHVATAQRSAIMVDDYRKANEITVSGRDVPKPILNLDEADFPECVSKILQAQSQPGTSPTNVQAQCWPVVFSGRDLVAVVPTSSEDKWLAYLVPALLHIQNQLPALCVSGPVALVLASTRELARQVQLTVSRFEEEMGVRTACLVSGEPKETQLKQLEEGRELWVATPGRLVALMEECKVSLRRCTFLVLDEADRMLAMGLEEQLRVIVTNVRPDRQMLVWLTSSTREACQLADEFMEDYVTVSVGGASQKFRNRVEHIVYVCEEGEKEERLVSLFEDILAEGRDKCVVFVETKRWVDDLVSRLRLRDWPAVGIHSKKTEPEREWALDAVRFGRVRILVTTDVATRELDAVDAQFVVNYVYPRSLDEYARRVEHAVREDGLGGRAYFFLAPTESRHAKELTRILRDVGQAVPEEVLKVARKTTR